MLHSSSHAVPGDLDLCNLDPRDLDLRDLDLLDLCLQNVNLIVNVAIGVDGLNNNPI